MSKHRSAKPNPRGYPDFAATAIINQLIQTAVQPRGRFTYEPYDETQISGYLTATGRGVFIARGCRGIIDRIGMYLKNVNTTEARSVTLLLTPLPNAGEIMTFTLTQAANTTGWVESDPLGLTWNYDSLAIIVKAVDSDLSYAYYNTGDFGLGCLRYYPSTRGATYHPLIRVQFDALSVGDIPVSGTLNVIEIPGVTTVPAFISVDLDGGSSQDIVNIAGLGIVEWLAFRLEKTAGSVDDAKLAITFVIDGVSTTWGLSGLNAVLGLTTKQTIGVTVNTYDDVNEIYGFAFNVPFRFHRSCRIYITNTADPGNITRLSAYALYHLKK